MAKYKGSSTSVILSDIPKLVDLINRTTEQYGEGGRQHGQEEKTSNAKGLAGI
jgi:hypothetical protein